MEFPTGGIARELDTSRPGASPGPTVKVRMGEDVWVRNVRAGEFSRCVLISLESGRMEFVLPGDKLIHEMKAPEPKTDDERYMLRALEIAERGRGRTSPNPLVGAVIVKDGEIVGEGYHAYAGGPHAEISALEEAGPKARDSVLYVTLEPCNHYGKTPPCARRIVEERVRRVIYATEDTNPDVKGGGAEFLRKARVEVLRGPYSQIAKRQNESYFKSVVTGIPFVTLKMGLSLDGKVATWAGKSKWITSDESRREVQRMRAASDAVVVGIGTVLSDDPLLIPRTDDAPAKKPLRVIVDSNCRIPPSSKVLNQGDAPTVVAVTELSPPKRTREIEKRGAEIIYAGVGEKVDLKALLGALASRGVRSVLLEGGPTLASSFLKERLIDKIVFFTAPIVLGGRKALGPFEGEGAKEIEDAYRFRIDTVAASGNDLKLIAYYENVG